MGLQKSQTRVSNWTTKEQQSIIQWHFFPWKKVPHGSMDRRPGQEARIGSFKSGWVWKRQLAWLFLKKWVKWKSLSHVRLSVTPWTIQTVEYLGQNAGVSSRFLLQRIFPTQGLNPGLLHCRQILYYLSHQRSPILKHITAAFWRHFYWFRS